MDSRGPNKKTRTINLTTALAAVIYDWTMDDLPLSAVPNRAESDLESYSI